MIVRVFPHTYGIFSLIEGFFHGGFSGWLMWAHLHRIIDLCSPLLSGVVCPLVDSIVVSPCTVGGCWLCVFVSSLVAVVCVCILCQVATCIETLHNVVNGDEVGQGGEEGDTGFVG